MLASIGGPQLNLGDFVRSLQKWLGDAVTDLRKNAVTDLRKVRTYTDGQAQGNTLIKVQGSQ